VAPRGSSADAQPGPLSQRTPTRPRMAGDADLAPERPVPWVGNVGQNHQLKTLACTLLRVQLDGSAVAACRFPLVVRCFLCKFLSRNPSIQRPATGRLPICATILYRVRFDSVNTLQPYNSRFSVKLDRAHAQFPYPKLIANLTKDNTSRHCCSRRSLINCEIQASCTIDSFITPVAHILLRSYLTWLPGRPKDLCAT
jgi:hypothetical protein